MRAYFEQRDALDDSELIEVSYRELQEDPLNMLRRIYAQLELPGFDTAAPRFEAYLDSQRDYRKNVLPLTQRERAAVSSQWREIFERLEYPV